MPSQPRKSAVRPGLHQKKHGQKGEGGDPALLLCTGEASPGVLRPDVEFSVQEKHGPVSVCPEEGHKNDPGDGTPPIRGQAERLGAVQPGNEKAVGRPESGLSVSKREAIKKKDADTSAECVVTGQGKMVSN